MKVLALAVDTPGDTERVFVTERRPDILDAVVSGAVSLHSRDLHACVRRGRAESRHPLRQRSLR